MSAWTEAEIMKAATVWILQEGGPGMGDERVPVSDVPALDDPLEFYVTEDDEVCQSISEDGRWKLLEAIEIVDELNDRNQQIAKLSERLGRWEQAHGWQPR